MKAKVISVFLICILLLVTSLTWFDRNNFSSDPYGIIQVEHSWELSPRLIKCSEDANCPEQAQAIFWRAAKLLSEASSETIEIDADDYNITKDMSEEKMIEALEPHLGFTEEPKYDLNDETFIRGFELMKRAHVAGSVFAANELGLMYFEQPNLRDLPLARSLLIETHAQGDAYGAYNLARLEYFEDPDNTAAILKHLRVASERGEADLITVYMIGLERFGNQQEQQAAKEFLSKEPENLKTLRRNFKDHFGGKE